MSGTGSARVLLASHYNATRYVYDSNAYEAIAGFARCDAADVLAPPRPVSSIKEKMDKLLRATRRQFGVAPTGRIEPVEIGQDYELFVYVASVLSDLADIPRYRGWRKRSRKAACVLLKTWSSEIEQNAKVLPMLNAFDVVYTATKHAVESLQAKLSVPVRYLPQGVSVLDIMPARNQKRPIDVYGMGRRPPALQAQLIQGLRNGTVNYHFDSFDPRVPFIKDFEGHSLMKASILKQTKFLPNFGVQSFASIERGMAGTEDIVPLRCFEGAAAGCVMFGSAPTSADFHERFDWEDVIVPVPSIDCDYIAFLHDLEHEEAARVERIRARNVRNSLLRNDLAYRYETILSDLGVAPHERLVAHKTALAQAAAGLADASGPTQGQVTEWGERPARHIPLAN